MAEGHCYAFGFSKGGVAHVLFQAKGTKLLEVNWNAKSNEIYNQDFHRLLSRYYCRNGSADQDET
jgi:hypothetical protein